MNTVGLINAINNFTKNSKKPRIINIDISSVDEHTEAILYFSNSKWNSIDIFHLNKFYDFPYYFNDESFKYFLPGFIKLNLENNEFNLFYDFLLNPLDSGNGIKGLDPHIKSQWSNLGLDGVDLAIEWIFWIINSENSYFEEDYLFRIAVNLEEIKKSI